SSPFTSSGNSPPSLSPKTHPVNICRDMPWHVRFTGDVIFTVGSRRHAVACPYNFSSIHTNQ
ncbi:MAG: hypothetical protein K1V76_00450, partial [Candidatus Amulumruptor sp.]